MNHVKIKEIFEIFDCNWIAKYIYQIIYNIWEKEDIGWNKNNIANRTYCGLKRSTWWLNFKKKHVQTKFICYPAWS